MKPPKCKICGKEHALGPCPAEAVATAIVDALLPPPRSRQKPEAAKPAKPKLQVIEGTPSEKLAKAREIIKEIENKPTRRKAKKSPNPQPAVLSPSDPPRSEAATREDAETPAGEPKPARKGNRHKPGYMAEYMRKRRAAAKEGKK